MTAFAALVGRDLRLALRAGGGGATAVLFFLIVAAIMPFALGPNLDLLAELGPAILWIGALLAMLLGLDRLFLSDHEDGALDGLRLSPMPLELTVLAKVLAHWIATGLPLVAASPAIGVFLNVPPASLAATALTLLVGTPALSFIGAIGAALGVSLRRGGLLVAVLVLPLAVPVLIFGVAAANAAARGTPMTAPLLILLALSLISAVFAPIAAAAALRAAE
jgi:heme exporter protein B